jgi:hypothetical protein
MGEMTGSTGEPKNAKDKEAAAKKGPSLPSISLPKGGDPTRGVAEKFAAKPITGTGLMTFPAYTSPDRSRFGPRQLTLFAYALAVVAVSAAVVASLELGSVVKHTPTLFFCSVVLSSWLGGVGPGIFAGLLSAIALDYYFIPPIYALGISPEEAPDMIVFVASASFVSWLNREQNQAKDSVRRWRDELYAKVRERIVERGQTQDRLQAEIDGHNIVEDGLIQEHVEEPRVARIATPGELAAPVADELGKVEELEHEVEGRTPAPEKMAAVLHGTQQSLAHPSTLRPEEESVFSKQGDYWTIRYQGQIVRLKATRGLQYLAPLLGHPGREFHVSELIAPAPEVPVAAVTGPTGGTSGERHCRIRTAHFQDAGPILDKRAKAEYARRLAELRGELEDAERLNDSERTERIRQERDCIANQLAVAVGLGGRNRKAASHAERARSAVTKRIKESIDRIAKAIPPLGRHLATRVRTGYFCSYNPDPDRHVRWKF